MPSFPLSGIDLDPAPKLEETDDGDVDENEEEAEAGDGESDDDDVDESDEEEEADGGDEEYDELDVEEWEEVVVFELNVDAEEPDALVDVDLVVSTV